MGHFALSDTTFGCSGIFESGVGGHLAALDVPRSGVLGQIAPREPLRNDSRGRLDARLFDQRTNATDVRDLSCTFSGSRRRWATVAPCPTPLSYSAHSPPPSCSQSQAAAPPPKPQPTRPTRAKPHFAIRTQSVCALFTRLAVPKSTIPSIKKNASAWPRANAEISSITHAPKLTSSMRPRRTIASSESIRASLLVSKRMPQRANSARPSAKMTSIAARLPSAAHACVTAIAHAIRTGAPNVTITGPTRASRASFP